MLNFLLLNTTSIAEVNDDFTILWILLSGILVFFMQAGFTLVESGFTRSKNAVNISMKNILDISVGTISFWFLGYGLMYGDTNGWIATSNLLFNPGDGAHDVFFQTVFCATAATIVSGAIAGRTKYSTYVCFTIFLTAIIYPISGGWQWNGDGWLAGLGFIDFAGSSIVHSVGGWAALVGAWMVGPRLGKYVDGKSNVIPGHNLLLGTLGVFILWLGWFGFNGGSVLSADPALTSVTLVNTCLAAAAGGLSCAGLYKVFYGKADIMMFMNGVLGGLVGITAGADLMLPGSSILIGIISGPVVFLSSSLLERAELDDPVGAIPVHLFCGIWGTLAVGIFGSMASFDQFMIQLACVGITGVFCIVAGTIIVQIVKAVKGLRVSEAAEEAGLDISEHDGSLAYAQFQITTKKYHS